MAAVPQGIPPLAKLDYQDYCRLPEDGRRHEILDGVHFVSPSPLDRHQEVCVNLSRLLAGFLHVHRLGKLRQAPSDVLLEDHTVVQPDHYLVLRENLHRLQRNGCHGPPDLVIEVLSPGNVAYDLVRKLPLYERAGVLEFWAVDPATERVEVYRRERPAPGSGTGPDGPLPRFARPLVLQASRGDSLDTPLLPGFAAQLCEVFDPGLATPADEAATPGPE